MLRNASRRFMKAHLKPAGAFPPKDRIRFACLSDTHRRHREINLPSAEVLLHSGDFTFNGRREEVLDFADWLRSLTEFKYKILIAGNHDFTFDPTWYQRRGRDFHARDLRSLSGFEKMMQDYFLRTSGDRLFSEDGTEDADAVKALLDNKVMREKFGVFYLEDSGVTISKRAEANGEAFYSIAPLTAGLSSADVATEPTAHGVHRIRIWGTPWSPDFHDWAFMFPRNTPDLPDKFGLVPRRTDILLSHTPPMGIQDLTFKKENVGSEALRQLLDDRIASGDPISVNVFGHIHESFGTTTFKGETLCVNAAMSEQGYKTSGRAVPVFDL